MSENGSEKAQDWVSQLQLRAAKQLEETQRMTAELEKLSITASSTDKSVTVTVDASGNMTDLKLTDAVKTRPVADLAADILAMQRKAQNLLGKGASQVVKDSVGLDTATGEAVMAGYRKRFSKKAFEAMDARKKAQQDRKGDKS